MEFKLNQPVRIISGRFAGKVGRIVGNTQGISRDTVYPVLTEDDNQIHLIPDYRLVLDLTIFSELGD